jgi:hypothetical protein
LLLGTHSSTGASPCINGIVGGARRQPIRCVGPVVMARGDFVSAADEIPVSLHDNGEPVISGD